MMLRAEGLLFCHACGCCLIFSCPPPPPPCFWICVASLGLAHLLFSWLHGDDAASRNVQSLVEQGQKGELTMQPGKSMMESLESSINKVR